MEGMSICLICYLLSSVGSMSLIMLRGEVEVKENRERHLADPRRDTSRPQMILRFLILLMLKIIRASGTKESL